MNAIFQVVWYGGANFFVVEDNGVESFSTVFLGSKEACTKYADARISAYKKD